ncbi:MULTISPECIES: M50 family metallopeptidase [Protofrankia]|uniref:Peptidase M50 n=1 Tax=Candidatus Protofrankia datiscae TaxID=2716812 RepID=F8B3C5_9ACTN|nr:MULTISPECIES: site-2 protease family protein [Protofrankia]AEH10932.1 peptidase M50 [Candidatus Protofrankia datiscae]
MTNAVGIVAFALALLVSILLHEAGHFVTARHYGMKASKFFVGFGPTLWSRSRGETEYGIKALPVGGFVKIEGMTLLEEIDPADAPRAFHTRPAYQRAVVLVAGSFMHFVIALVLIYGVLLALGTSRPSENTVGRTVCVPVANECAPGAPAGPAERAGVRAGDQVVSFDGTPITSWNQFTRLIRTHGAGVAPLVVERDGRTVTLYPELVSVMRDRQTGLTGNDPVGAIGIAQGYETVRYNPISAVPKTLNVLGGGVTGMYDTLVHRLDELANLFSPDRNPNGLVGVVGAARVGGELLSAPDTSASQRIGDFVVLVAGVNLAVGLFNLLPLFPLDGGHLAVLGFEQARHGVRRLAGYRGPIKRVDLVKLMPAAYVMVASFALLSLLILFADIVNPIRFN